MNKGRMEAFSDGVLAIIITIMVLEFKVPHGADFSDLKPLIPVAMSYLLSFIYIGIYWNNHHHLVKAAPRIGGDVLWANLHLLFWLSLVPFGTAWMGENHFSPATLMLYGIILLMAAVAYTLLQNRIIAKSGKESLLSKAIGKDKKGKVSLLCYLLAISLAYFNQLVAGALYVLVAIIWLIPDKRIEKILEE